MLLAPGEPIFRDVPPKFLSPFPSAEAQADGKFQALEASASAEGATVNEKLVVQQQGKAFAGALAIVNQVKAVDVGDLLTDWLPRVAWLVPGKTGGDIVQGIFGQVPWGRLSSLKPDAVAKVMGEAGLNAAMTAMSAIPVYGQVASALVGAGKLMFRLFNNRQKNAEGVKLALPWTTYSRDIDEDYLGTLRDTVFRTVDWSRIFLPPFELEPWKVSLYVVEKNPKGLILIPAKGKEAAWASGVGCMPGTFRIAGQVQGIPPQLPDAVLVRHVRRPKGMTPREAPIFWRQELTACGDFLPSVAQLGAAVWQQVQAAGNPDMYKVQVSSVDTAWRKYFENLWATAQAAMDDAGKSIGAIVGYDPIQAANLVGQLVEPYLCHRLTTDSPWQLGVPAGYRPFSLFHKGIFKSGPVTPDQRNACLFVEDMYPLPKDGEPYWPYGGAPKEHPKLRAGVFQQYTSPATDAAPLGYRCTAYPPRELAGAGWSSPYEAFIKPQLDALAKRQRDCLASTLVCAYVRPVGYEGLATYAAFAGKAGEELRERCLDIREQLLKNDARFLVNLKDVHDIDPKFEKKLRESGVSNSPGQMSAARFNLKSAGGVVEAPEPAEAPPAGGGVAFGDLVGRDEGGSGGLIAGLLGGGLVLGGGIAAVMNRGGGKRHGRIRR